MTRLLVELLLSGAVLCGLVGILGFLRLRDTLDRLHCAAFSNASVGILLCVAAFVSDGWSDRALKMAIVTAAALLGGAATSHVIGRAMVARGDVPEALPLSALPMPSDPPRQNQELG